MNRRNSMKNNNPINFEELPRLVLTFENVMEVFKDYLNEDNMYEIVSTSHGYTIMEWDRTMEDWSDSRLCKTPQDMFNELLDCYTGFLEYKATYGKTDSTENVKNKVNDQRKAFLDRFR